MSGVENIQKDCIKCAMCRVWLNKTYFINTKGRQLKCCSDCRLKQKDLRQKNKCEHGIQYYACKDCGGSSICGHDKQRFKCKICTPLGYLQQVVYSRIRATLKQKQTKTLSDYLGCSIADFKIHIEKQFSPDMNWDNHGTYWDIDHIVPIKYNNPSLNDMIDRFNYTNTQPLEKELNRLKGSRYIRRPFI